MTVVKAAPASGAAAHPRYIVTYWIESPSPYLVIDTEADSDGVAQTVGAFTASMADRVAKALNFRHEAEQATPREPGR